MKLNFDKDFKEFGVAIGKKNQNPNYISHVIASTSSTPVVNRGRGGSGILIPTPHHKNTKNQIHFNN